MRCGDEMMEMADGHKGNYESQTKAFSFTHGESRHNELRCLTRIPVALVWRWLAKDNLPHVLRQEPSPVSLCESAHRVRFPMRLTRLESFQDLTQRIVWCAFIRDELSNGVGDQKAVTWGNQRCSDKLLQLKLQLSQDHTHHAPVAY